MAIPIPPTSFLIKDNGEVKTYSNGWLPVADASEETFLSQGITNLSTIPSEAWNDLGDTFEVLQYVSDKEYSKLSFETESYSPIDLLGEEPKVLMYHDDKTKTAAVGNLTAVPHGQLVFQEGDIDVSSGAENIRVEVPGFTSSKGLIPAMDSDISPEGTSSTNSFLNAPRYSAYKAFNKDSSTNYPNSPWLSVGGQKTAWIAYEFPIAKLVGKYSMEVGKEDPSKDPDRMPKNWTFEGTNDGINWAVLDTRNDVSNWRDFPKQTFTIDSPSFYKKYRINISANNGDYYIGIGEIEMFEAPPLGADVKILVSGDGGESWHGKSSVDTSNLIEVKESGFTPEEFNALAKEELASFFPNGTARFAYYLEQVEPTDIVLVDSLTIQSAPVATETPSLDSVSVKFKELTIEGRLQDIERINAINMAKLQFKTNALIKSEKYRLHDLVVDTFEEDSLEVVDSRETKSIEVISTEPVEMEGKFYSEIDLKDFKNIKGVEIN